MNSHGFHDYYIIMEEVPQKYILERAQRQSKLPPERALIESHKQKSVNYLGNTGKVGVEAGKFGESPNRGKAGMI